MLFDHYFLIGQVLFDWHMIRDSILVIESLTVDWWTRHHQSASRATTGTMHTSR